MRKFLNAFVLALTFFIFGWYGHKFFGHLNERPLEEVKPLTPATLEVPKKKHTKTRTARKSMKLDVSPARWRSVKEIPEMKPPELKPVAVHGHADPEMLSLASQDLPTPQQVVDLLLSESLEFVFVDGSEDNSVTHFGSATPVCLWRGQYMIVLTNYCTSNHESRAAAIQVFMDNGTIMRFYADTGTYDKPVSQVGWEDYELFYLMLFRTPDPTIDISMPLDQFFSFYEKHDWDEACVVGNGGAAHCSAPYQDEGTAWEEQADVFIANPGSRWFTLLKLLREQMVKCGMATEHYYE